MKPVITNDGSPTFWNSRVNEHYHSLTGAKEEAIKKFVEPCRLQNTENAVIIDVCFGFGYNAAAAFDARGKRKTKVIGFEKDTHVLQLIPRHAAPFASYAFLQECIKNRYQLQKGNWKLQILVGDARKKIQTVRDGYADAIFFDPFSPKKAPELWTERLFHECYRILKRGGVLTTYSCARIVRKNLQAAGFTIVNGPCVGRRGPSTVATKT